MIEEKDLGRVCHFILDTYFEQLECVETMRKSKFFKLAYLLTRFDSEFIKGNAESRKAFVKWAIHRKAPRAMSKQHYVMRMENALSQLKQEVSYKLLPEELFEMTPQEYKRMKREKEIQKIHEIMAAYEGKKVFVFPDVVDWNIPLFQRPQQVAMALSHENVLFIYVTPNYRDRIWQVTQVKEHCYLITKDLLMDVLEIAGEHHLETVLNIYSTDNLHSLEEINGWKKFGSSILYEYIDEISTEITGVVPKLTMDRHRAFLKDENVFVLATADKLYQEVLELRGSSVNTLNSGNGVDCEHFEGKTDISLVPDKIRPIIEKNKPVIGYFGAIANWFDFELIKYSAQSRPDYEFLMIGPQYGSHDMSVLEELKKIPNLHFVGTVEYKVLPYVANHFTVATIPFQINEITESTSPIKLFEYMAMGKPCVTTAMRECFKYPVVKVAKNQEEYVMMLDQAVQEADDAACIAQLKAVADQNSWRQKAREMMQLLGG